jgi:hypothetical protein
MLVDFMRNKLMMDMGFHMPIIAEGREIPKGER